MTHYVCPVCGGKSDHPKSCDTQGCAREGQPLVACGCEDDQHIEAKKSESPFLVCYNFFGKG